MSPKWKKNVCNLISSYSIVVYELEPAYGDHTPCEGLVDKTNSIKHADMGLFYIFPHPVDSKLEM